MILFVLFFTNFLPFFDFGFDLVLLFVRVQVSVELNLLTFYFKLFKIVSDRSSLLIETLCKTYSTIQNKIVFIVTTFIYYLNRAIFKIALLKLIPICHLYIIIKFFFYFCKTLYFKNINLCTTEYLGQVI